MYCQYASIYGIYIVVLALRSVSKYVCAVCHQVTPRSAHKQIKGHKEETRDWQAVLLEKPGCRIARLRSASFTASLPRCPSDSPSHGLLSPFSGEFGVEGEGRKETGKRGGEKKKTRKQGNKETRKPGNKGKRISNPSIATYDIYTVPAQQATASHRPPRALASLSPIDLSGPSIYTPTQVAYRRHLPTLAISPPLTRLWLAGPYRFVMNLAPGP